MTKLPLKGFDNRYLIECVLVTKSPLHIGDGGTVHRDGLFVELDKDDKDKNRRVDVASVATDHAGRPYLPGRTLKGNLRSWLEQVGIVSSHKDLVDEVFGRAGTRAPGKPGEDAENADDETAVAAKGFLGGKAQFLDAFALPQDEQTLPAFEAPSGGRPWERYWDSTRLTCVSASTAIDRRTRTVRGGKLFHEEFVPAGIAFQVRLLAENLTDDERDLLLFAIDGFSKEEFPVCLGSGRGNGRGRFSVREGSLTARKLDKSGVQNWLSSGRVVPAIEAVTRFGTQMPLRQFEPSPPSMVRMKLRITVDGPFLVNDPSRAHTKGERGPDDFDHVYLRDEQGRALLPADSLRGALRSQAERIVRTLGQEACHIDVATGPDHCCDEVKKAKDVDNLCVVCRLFGGTGWASAVHLSDFPDVKERPAGSEWELKQEFVAIDRVTGGSAEHLKFNAKSVVDPVLEGTLTVALDRLRPKPGEIAPLELLRLTLRDLAEGDIPLGFGAAKGYGECTAEIIGPVDLVGPARDNPTLTEFAKAAADILRPVTPAAGDGDREAQHDGSLPVALPVAAAAASVAPPIPNDALFHNPYHFVPFDDRVSRPGDLPVDDFMKGLEGHATHAHVTHDRYVPNSYSGRITCRLTTVTPLVVGAAREPGDRDTQTPAVVHPFLLRGQPAIPASSLRGLISSVAETASNSAMRVLTNRSLSFRVAMGEAMGAVGVLVDDGGVLKLLPLSLPPLRQWDHATKTGAIPAEFGRLFKNGYAPFPAYVEGYSVQRKDGRPVRRNLAAGSFLAGAGGTPVDSFGSDKSDGFFWANLSAVSRTAFSACFTSPREKETQRQGQSMWTLIGCQIQSQVLTQAEYDKLLKEKPQEMAKYCRGVLRVFGNEGVKATDEVPITNKKHELFVPYPQDARDRAILLDVTGALARFHRLSDERTEAEKDEEFPFALRGSKRNASRDPKDHRIRLRAGDLVFFRPEKEDERVQEVSISSIWRGDAGQLFDYVGAEWQPFHTARTGISLAEQLFGFVENGKRPGRQDSIGLAGRVRFSFARPVKKTGNFLEVEGERIPIGILATPKPPSPSLYFKRGDGSDTPILKRDLKVGADPDPRSTFRLQGRKFYLHAFDRTGQPWQGALADDRKNHLRAVVRPVAAGVSFDFHVDFDNLSLIELGLLCYSLQPTPKFRHKLGLGKPIGLGTVQIEPVDLCYVDRAVRYCRGTDSTGPGFTGRYARVHEIGMMLGGAPDPKVSTPASPADPNPSPTFDACLKAFVTGASVKILKVLELFGDPTKVKNPVSYPFLLGSASSLEEHFHWFVAYEQGKVKDPDDPQGRRTLQIRRLKGLQPIKASNPELPTLLARPVIDPGARPGGGGYGGRQGGGGPRAGHQPSRGGGGGRGPR